MTAKLESLIRSKLIEVMPSIVSMQETLVSLPDINHFYQHFVFLCEKYKVNEINNNLSDNVIDLIEYKKSKGML